ncbi:hypothetical protein GCM10027405_39440 [Arthrobacter alkaliphilus]
MAKEEQNRVLDLIEQATGDSLRREACPDWLRRPGITGCGQDWGTVKGLYRMLTGLELPNEMPPRETRRLDAIWTDSSGRSRVIEYDEGQHFNKFRNVLLGNYPDIVPVAFDKERWMIRCTTHEDIRGGGFSKPRPPLFPMDGGRNYQRAFRDMLADVLPPARGWRPTLRIGHFEVDSWLYTRDAVDRMRNLLASKLM